jgi:internalin A
MRSLNLFLSYCDKDEEYRKRLEIQLKPLQRQGVIASWDARLIRAGQEWNEQISLNLELADIIVLLVSADFLASDYCYDIEMARALERHQAGTARVIPVIVRDVHWSDAPFGKLQALPRGGKAVKSWPNRDAAWADVFLGIKAVANDLRKEGG